MFTNFPESRQDRLDSLGERGKHRQADAGVSDVKYTAPPSMIQVRSN